MTKQYFVKAEWDAEAGVWYIADTDVPGLVAEAETLEGLGREVCELVPEMLELNAHLLDDDAPHPDVPISLIAHQEMKICA